MKQISLIVIVLFILLLSSCKSRHEETVQKIKEVSALLDMASRVSETEFVTPIGLNLNCNENDINSFYESLIDKDVQIDGENLIIKTSEFGNIERQVKNYLKKTLKDSDSYENIKWGKVIENNGSNEVKHTYRAKNSFGGML